MSAKSETETNPIHGDNPMNNSNDNQNDKDKQLHIFVNRIKFDREAGVKDTMSADDIAKLVDLTAETATVKWATGKHAGEEVTSKIEIKNGDQFLVTRKQVKGGYVPRIEAELARLHESGQKTTHAGPYIIYHDVLTGRGDVPFTDVMVALPNGYPASMLDRAALPSGSPLLGRVHGQPQDVVTVEGKAWQFVSYHPHGDGGGKPWNPQKHGLHTYLTEIIAWLAVNR